MTHGNEPSGPTHWLARPGPSRAGDQYILEVCPFTHAAAIGQVARVIREGVAIGPANVVPSAFECTLPVCAGSSKESTNAIA